MKNFVDLFRVNIRMIFTLNLLFSVIYCDIVSRGHESFSHYSKFTLYLPLLIVWTLICGSQYYVGTDYPSYIAFFNGTQLDRLSNTSEIGFIFFIKILNSIGIKGQGIFFIIYSISFLILFKILEFVPIKYWGLFILLYIVASTLFNNQLNIVRQCLAIYIGTYASINIYKGDIFKGILLICLATSFHLTAILFLVFFFYRSIMSQALSIPTLTVILAVGVLGGNLILDTIFNSLVTYLPPAYAWHIKSGGVIEVEGIQKITKYIYVPLYFLAIISSDKMHLTSFHRWLFNWGIIGFAIRMLLVNLQIVNRISLMFIIISIFPLLYYCINLIKSKKYIIISAVYGILIAFYIIKVLIAPTNEYAYDSIFLHII